MVSFCSDDLNKSKKKREEPLGKFGLVEDIAEEDDSDDESLIGHL